jgi:hypothetical protein
MLPLRHAWLPDDFGHDPVALQALGLISTAFERLPCTAPGAPLPGETAVLLGKGVNFFWKASDVSQVASFRSLASGRGGLAGVRLWAGFQPG